LIFSPNLHSAPPPAAPDIRSVNLRAELFISTRFRSAICEPDLR